MTRKTRICTKPKIDGRTLTGKINLSGGGVARNIADALGKLHINPYLISALGNEQFANFILHETIPHLSSSGILRSTNHKTATCMVLCDKTGECMAAVGDMDIHNQISVEHLKKHERVIAHSSLAVVDGNLSQEAIEFLLNLCHDNAVPAWYEPTDMLRASKPFLNRNVSYPTFISPNFLEFRKIYEAVVANENEKNMNEYSDSVEECIAKGYQMAKFFENIIITLGEKGVMIIRKAGPDDPFFNLSTRPEYISRAGEISHRLYKFELLAKKEIINVSGAGDCFASGFIAAMLRGQSERSCIEFGFKCSTASLKCFKTVPPEF